MLSNTLRLNVCYLIIYILHPQYHPKAIGLILKNNLKTKNVCIHTIKIMKIKMKIKNRSHRYDINRPRIIHKIFDTNSSCHMK